MGTALVARTSRANEVPGSISAVVRPVAPAFPGILLVPLTVRRRMGEVSAFAAAFVTCRFVVVIRCIRRRRIRRTAGIGLFLVARTAHVRALRTAGFRLMPIPAVASAARPAVKRMEGLQTSRCIRSEVSATAPASVSKRRMVGNVIRVLVTALFRRIFLLAVLLRRPATRRTVP